MILYDYKCTECGITHESFGRVDQYRAKCPSCGGVSVRLMSTPRIALDGTDPAFSTAWDKWAKVHEDAAKRAYKRDDLGGLHNGDN